MNEYRKQQLRAAELIEQGATAEQVAAVYGWIRGKPEPIETCDKRTLTPRRKCGIIKAIRRHVNRWKQKQEGKKMKIENIIEKINNSCKPFNIGDLREIFTAANSAEGLKLLECANDTDDIPIDIIDSALYNLGYYADDAGTYRKL